MKFVVTEELKENLTVVKKAIQSIKDPAGLIVTILTGSVFILLYFCLIIIADIIGG